MSMLAPESRLLSTVDPALSLLEAVGTPRSEALLSIAATLRSRLLAHLPSMPSHRREELLLLTIRTECWWDAAELLPVVAGLIEHSITLPPPLLHALAGPQRAALTHLTPGAHRKLAELATDTFGNDLFGPHILEFTDGSRWRSLLDDTLGRHPQLPPPKRRAQCNSLQSLGSLVGSATTYRSLITLLNDFYVNTEGEGSALCALLRADLLMALHERDAANGALARWEPCHRFASCLEMAVRDAAVSGGVSAGGGSAGGVSAGGVSTGGGAAGAIEWRLLRQLIAAVAAAGLPPAPAVSAAGLPPQPTSGGLVGGLSQQSLGDMALLLSSPPSLQLLARSALRRLKLLVEAGCGGGGTKGGGTMGGGTMGASSAGVAQLPSEDAELCASIQLLLLAAHATVRSEIVCSENY